VVSCALGLLSRSIQSLIRTLSSVNYLETKLLRPAPLQLREDLGELKELQESIKENGLLQPIIVRPRDGYFDVIAGNRRLAACRQLHLLKVLCVIKEVSDKEAYEIALTENVQRRTLDPVEEAKAFKNYIDKFGYGGVSELASRIGKSEEYVSHRVHLLTLPTDVLGKVSSRLLSPTTANELAWLDDAKKQSLLADESIKKKMSAKKVRTVVRLMRGKVEFKDAIDTVLNAKNDFDRDYVRDRATNNDSVRAINEVILVLKGTLIQLDSILEERVLEKNQVREELIAKRFGVHKLLDETFSLRKQVLKETN